MPEFLEVCEQAARRGGQILLDWQGKFTSREKGRRDLVTEADEASQLAIQDLLLGAFPDHDFVGEEDPKSAGNQRKSPFRWIVDPLDGTANYVHGMAMYAVSIALEREGEIIAGTVFDPVANECYSAAKGRGATLNGRPLRVSRCTEANEALIAVSFAANVERESREIGWFIESLLACQSVRRLGSAALNLAYLAAGRMDAYLTTSVKIWDIAAGVLLVTESGGTLQSLDGSPINLEKPEFLASATPELQRELLQVLRRA